MKLRKAIPVPQLSAPTITGPQQETRQDRIPSFTLAEMAVLSAVLYVAFMAVDMAAREDQCRACSASIETAAKTPPVTAAATAQSTVASTPNSCPTAAAMVLLANDLTAAFVVCFRTSFRVSRPRAEKSPRPKPGVTEALHESPKMAIRAAAIVVATSWAMPEQTAAITTALACWQPSVKRMLSPAHAAVAAPIAGPTAVHIYASTWLRKEAHWGVRTRCTVAHSST
mmetsp:Transcript_3895/g.8207  ORF Transcript_3895/g.8207 Transcript_3895/m.8207 type:complete len:227 (+) Transcript_3895:329-1009(+)